MSGERHWLTRAKCGDTIGSHMLLYVEEKRKNDRVTPGIRRAWTMDIGRDETVISMAGEWDGADSIDSIVHEYTAKNKNVTIWLMRGWTDMVLSGLCELMDAGIITWRYASLSGRCCMVKGAYRSRAITVSALSNWTGNARDGWGDVGADQVIKNIMAGVEALAAESSIDMLGEERSAIESLIAIVSICQILRIKRVPPTSGAAGITVWRQFVGPVVKVAYEPSKKASPSETISDKTYVVPIPSRPLKAAAAERHVCYALTTRQLRSGLVEGPIYCADMSSAYLYGMCSTPIPGVYERSLHKPSVSEMVKAMNGHTALALVRVNSDKYSYPARVNKRAVQCRGKYWTWLCGMELVNALMCSHVDEIYTAHVWSGHMIGDESVRLIMSLKTSLDDSGFCAMKSAWRSIYSSLVGRFAGWSREWRDSPAHAGFGRWAQWIQSDPETGVLIPHRSIAGKVQKLAKKTDKSDSVPLLFGCVTSRIRWCVQSVVEAVGIDHVCNVAADCLWLDTKGWQQSQKVVSEHGGSPDNISVKAIYDRVWMTGGAVAVAERHGTKYLLMPGVSRGASLDGKGRVVVEHTDDWGDTGDVTARNGVGRRKHAVSATKIVEKYSYPARVQQLGELVDIPLLGENLLQPLYGERTIEDA
jgi:hypothetical protein